MPRSRPRIPLVEPPIRRHSDETPPGRALVSRWRGWLGHLGPGLITGAADDDPSGIATYSQAGALFGYSVIWTLLLTFPLMVGIQLASARIGRITGKGLAENFRRLAPAWVVWLLVALLVIANVINLAADLNAMGDVLALIVHGPAQIYTVMFGLVSLGLQVWLPYTAYVRVLKWLTLTLFAYVGVAFTVDLDWHQALVGAVLPNLQWSTSYVTGVVAIFGTTISPYLFFWQATQEVEEIRRVDADKPLRIAPKQARVQLRRLKWDTIIGMAFSNGIALFIMLATAATLHKHGITTISTTQQAAEALRPIGGPAAFVLFALGVIGTGMLAIPVLAGSAAYAVASLFRFRQGLSLKFRAAVPFYLLLAAAVIIGIAIGISGLDAVRALYWSAVINAVISVPIMVAVMLVASNRRLLGPLVLSSRWRILGWLATLAMLAATIAMFATMLWPSA